MQEIDFYLVDAFSDKAFGGNTAAVCPLQEWLPDEVLLNMAKQHNQSETAFLVRTDTGFDLRWFTTQYEINLCGHATLAAAHVIFEYLDYPQTDIVFSTRFVGELTVKRSGDWLTLNFPAWSSEEVANPPALLFSALGIDCAKEVRAGRDYMVVLETEQQVADLLIPYWSDRLGKTTLLARQISARGGDLRCALQGDRVLIGGQATLYLKGKIFLRL